MVSCDKMFLLSSLFTETPVKDYCVTLCGEIKSELLSSPESKATYLSDKVLAADHFHLQCFIGLYNLLYTKLNINLVFLVFKKCFSLIRG